MKRRYVCSTPSRGMITTVACAVMILAFHAGTAAAREGLLELSAQSANVRGWVDEALGAGRAPWDEATGMVGNGASHSSRQTMLYAAGLILRNRPEDIERATRAIRVVLKLQYDAPGMDWHGTYKLNEREPDQPKPTLLEKGYDENWREFIGTAQIMILEGCPERLDPALREEIRAALRRACEGAHARQVSWRYTNIAIMSAYLLAWGGRQFEESAWSRHGAELAGEIYNGFVRYQAFQEYNSPTYSGADLYALAIWRALPVFPEMADRAREMEAGFWRDLARHYHADLGNFCGPFDRSYGMDMRKYLALCSLGIALALDLPTALPDPADVEHHEFETAFLPLMAALGMNMPEDAAAHFRAFQGPRRFDQTIEQGEYLRTAQSWIERMFMVGAEQTTRAGYEYKTAHPFTLHWKTPDNDVGWIRMLQEAPVEARIAKNNVVFAPMQNKPPLSARNLVFEVFSPGATIQSFQAARWELPGMPIAVENHLPSPSIEPKKGCFTISYPLAGKAHKGELLNFQIQAPASSTATP